MAIPPKNAPLTAKSTQMIAAFKHASRHRDELDRSARCGCFFCFRTFVPGAIHHWIDENQTALCPSCGIDSVIGTASGFAIDDRFLRRMHQHHFTSAK